MTPESEASFAVRPPGSLWRSEPFRVFFPLGVVLTWVGVGHWLLYALGAIDSYSCLAHGLVQMQGFMMAFALGFLLTAVPRRTRSDAPSAVEMSVLAAAVVATGVTAILELRLAAQLSYLLVFVVLLRFALRRFRGAGSGRKPPPSFVLIPIGVLHGIGGAALLAASTSARAPVWTSSLGALLVEQGVFLCFVMGIGGLFLPLVSGRTPPADLGSSPAERWKATGFALAGLGVFASLVAEEAGWIRGGPLARAAIAAAGIAVGAGGWRPPGKPGLPRRLVWIAMWFVPLGLLLSGLLPDYRVPALHVLFIGGFGLMAFSVATHVSLGHLGLESLALGRPLPVIVLAAAFLVAMLARVAADWSDTYFEHLAWAAAFWIAGSAVWLGFLGPKWLRR